MDGTIANGSIAMDQPQTTSSSYENLTHSQPPPPNGEDNTAFVQPDKSLDDKYTNNNTVLQVSPAFDATKYEDMSGGNDQMFRCLLQTISMLRSV